jgi:poly-beta-1,6-N-acetyl-D-glucosamine synthase
VDPRPVGAFRIARTTRRCASGGPEGQLAARCTARTRLGLGALLMLACNAALLYRDRALSRRLRSGREQSDARLPDNIKVSVVVAAWNESATIERHIQSVLALRYPNIQYIVCAGGQDDTYALAVRYAGPRVKVIPQAPGDGKQTALRKALKYVTGEIVYLTDADCLVNDASFEQLLLALIDNQAVAASAGALMPLPEQWDNPFVTYQWAVQAYGIAHLPTRARGLLGMNCAVRTSALGAVGGFDQTVVTGTDYHLAKRLLRRGGEIRQVSSAMASTQYPETWREYLLQQSRWAKNVLLHGPRFGAWGEVALVLRNSTIGCAMLASLLAFPWLSSTARTLWLIAFLQACIGKWRYISFARGLHLGKLRFPPIQQIASYALAEFAVWATPLIAVLVPQWRKRW